jgi:hypothetical protein
MENSLKPTEAELALIRSKLADKFSSGLDLGIHSLGLFHIRLEDEWMDRFVLNLELYQHSKELRLEENLLELEDLTALIEVWQSREEYEYCLIARALSLDMWDLWVGPLVGSP